MNFAFPSFEPPADLPPPGLFLLFQPKKAGKTTIAQLLCSTLVARGYEIEALRNDVHDRLDVYVKSQRIELATTHDAIEGNISLDLDRHEVLIEAIERLTPESRTAIVYDSSAAAGERLPTVLLRDLYAQQLEEQSRSCVCLVPLRPTDDIAAGALYAVNQLEIAMPGQPVVPIVIAQDADLAQLRSDHAFFKVIEKAKHGVIRMPYFPAALAFHIDRLPMRLSDIADPRSLSVRRQVRESLGCSLGQAGLVVAAVADLVAIVDAQLSKLGYPENPSP